MKLTNLVFSASLALAATAPAAVTYSLHETGYFGPTTTLGGTALGGVTSFSFDAQFDPAADLNASSGDGLYAITGFSITIGGTTYTAAPASTLNVCLSSLSSIFPVVGLAPSDSSDGIKSAFNVATPAYSPNNPAPSVLTGNISSAVLSGYTIALNGGAGNLVVNDLANPTSFTAEITAVPEPGMAGISLLGAGAFFLRRRRA